jgi:hypothetical protein
LTELQADKCRHGNPNSCVHCGIRREDEPIKGANGSIIWQVHWVPRDPKTGGGNDAGAHLPLGVDAASALIKGDEGRADLGLGPFGDDRGAKTVAELKEPPAAQNAAALMRMQHIGAGTTTERFARAMAPGRTPFPGFGFPVVIEVPDGGTRSGTSPDGTEWQSVLRGTAYGFVPNTTAADGEELDVLVGTSVTSKLAFVIDQGDECKLAIGFDSASDARAAYTNNWPPGMLKGFYAVPMSVVTAMLAQEAA